ncbi:toll/interleukin-1 receptor domain-containing protein [Plantactinospora sp. WMMC1484]|uniref:toll/interleukin-1 receptor domain-containing protein n=1 Tax=Plantactinospora sp. WMMC1484 TaxID=3404122 RepID=UPI003BF4A2EE
MIDIVVNYRTADEPLAALLIDQALTKRIGERVFRDYRTIGPGQRYPGTIWTAIQECRILVAVIGNRWLDVDPHGERRIDDPSDYVRREIAEALRRRVRVVPILVGDATLPVAEDLPEDLRDLPLHQYRTLRIRGIEQEVERVADELVALLDGPPDTEPTPPAAGRPGAAPAQSTVTNNFHDRVDASHGVFGVVVNRGE